MATRFRLTAQTATPFAAPAMQSYTHASATRRRLLLGDSSTLTETAQTPDAADDLVAGDTSHIQFVSGPLAVGTVFTSGDAFKYAIQAFEANAGNNLFLQVWIGIVSRDGASALATIRTKTADNTELATSLTNRTFSGTLSGSYTCNGGERLVIEISVTGTPTAAGGTQGHNATIRWGGSGSSGDLPEDDSTTATTFNPWIEFASTIVLQRSQALLGVG